MLDVLINQTGKKQNAKKGLRISGRADKPVKSAIKAISWRIVGTLDTMLISYIITGKFTVALSIGSVEVITKTFLYYFHERLWAYIQKIQQVSYIRKKRLNIRKNEHKGVETAYRRKINTGITENIEYPVSRHGSFYNQLWN